MPANILEWLIAGLLGAVISSAEIISRYRDEPQYALRTWPSLFYMLVNALASVGTLAIIHTLNWTFGVSDPDLVGWAQVFVAGFGAMAILRASLFSVQVGDEAVPIGLKHYLDVLLASVDRAVDRKRA